MESTRQSARSRCPICGKSIEREEPGRPGSVFPFCSSRCRDVDLGRWLDGKYQLPVELTDEDALPDGATHGGPRATPRPPPAID